MPISAMGPYDAGHWSDVRAVIYRAAENAGMKPQLVSDSIETDIIQERIVLNLYENPVVICDVSGLNPNVMFELGMRLTFNKPTIVITDDISALPFDTRVIEHLAYPPSLHFHQIEEFIKGLSLKISELRDRAKRGAYKSFIESFGKFEIVQPDTQNVGFDKYVVERLDQVAASIRRIERSQRVDLGRSLNAFEMQERNALAHNLNRSSRDNYVVSYMIVEGEDRVSDLTRLIANLKGVNEITVSSGKEGSTFSIQLDQKMGKFAEAEIRSILDHSEITYITF